MIKCSDTNHMFGEIMNNLDNFFEADDWSESGETNYQANKDYIDQQWGYMNDSWARGVHFDAGMFYGRVAAKYTDQQLLSVQEETVAEPTQVEAVAEYLQF